MKIKCPKCKHEFEPSRTDIARYLGSRTSRRKAKASAENGRLGGRPRKKKSKLDPLPRRVQSKRNWK